MIVSFSSFSDEPLCSTKPITRASYLRIWIIGKRNP